MSRPVHLAGNPNLDDALRAARALGCSVTPREGHGEDIVRHPSWQTTVVVNVRRKSTPNHLLKLLRRLAAAATP